MILSKFRGIPTDALCKIASTVGHAILRMPDGTNEARDASLLWHEIVVVCQEREGDDWEASDHIFCPENLMEV